MKRSLNALCLLLCLAASASPQTPESNVNAGAAAAPAQNANVANANANMNANVGAANADVTGPVTLTVQPGHEAKIEVGPKAEPPKGLDPLFKDLVDAVSKLLTFVSIGVAIFLAWQQFNKNRDDRKKDRDQSELNRQQREQDVAQREEELRWKKAQLAKEVIDQIHSNPYASDAMLMLDWNGRRFCVKANRNQKDGAMERITWPDMWAALRVTELHFNDKEKYIRDCFDDFFGYMQRLAHYISIKLIDPADVRHPFDYYIAALDRNKFMFDNFIEKYHPRAAGFIDGVKALREQSPVTSPDFTSPPAVTSPPDQKFSYFMFDCPPGEERFIIALEDPAKIEQAREILRGHDEELTHEVEKHVSGRVVGTPAFYNAPWRFHVAPDSVEFLPADQGFADEVSRRAEAQTGNEPALFAHDDIWHTGGARLLAELPGSRFKPETGQRRDREEAELWALGRVAAAGVTSPPGAAQSQEEIFRAGGQG